MRDDLNRRLEEVHTELLSGSTGEAEKNMNDIQKTLDGTRTREYCMHPVINAILAEKEHVCQSRKIATEFELLVPRTLHIDALHLCSIFSNLLDNAIEAVSELPEEKRRITLKAELKNTYLVVRTDNPSTREHAERRIRKDHGYGTRILESLAQKYEGSYSGHYGDGVYRAIVAVKVG